MITASLGVLKTIIHPPPSELKLSVLINLGHRVSYYYNIPNSCNVQRILNRLTASAGFECIRFTKQQLLIMVY